MKRIKVNAKVLADNEKAAEQVRRRFCGSGTLVLNLISSPGSGKTSLLEATVAEMRTRYRMGCIVGDIATERDAERMRRLGIPARQILTGGACHLDARLVQKALGEGGFDGLDFLFIENVGNLICPTSYDLGEDFKIALLSVTEGDDKPFKYPGLFARAAVTLITKTDLRPHVAFDLEAVRAQVASLNPAGRLLMVSAKSGEGIPEWARLLRESLATRVSPCAKVS